KVEISEEYGVRMTLEYVMNRSVLDRVTVQTPDGYKEIFDMNDINQCQSATLYDEKGVAVYVSEYVYENYDGGDPILKKIVFKDQDGNDIEKEYRFEYDSIDSYRATYKVYDEIGNPVSEDLVGNEYYRGSHRWFYIRTHGE
ncbi:MAG: hypothetical protein J6M12_02230, partial [Clostridia bacterium]|nr:hypothetical protein [Clostridia bacterium]